MKNCKRLFGGCLALLLVLVLGVGAAQAQVNAYVANLGSSELQVIDVATNTVVDTIPVSGPSAVAVNTAGSRAYVTGVGGVVVVDLASSSVVTTVPTGPVPTHLVLSNDGSFLYVNSTDPVVTVIDTATNTVVATVPLAGQSRGLAVTPDGTSVWVSQDAGSGAISVIDTVTNTVTSTFSAVRSESLVFTPDGAFLYASDNDSNNCVVFDTATRMAVATIPTGARPQGNAISPSGAAVYQVNTSGGSVSVIDTATNTVIATVEVGLVPDYVALTPDGAFAYVTGEFDSAVFVIDTATNTVAATIPVGGVPRGITIAQTAASPPVLASDHASVTVNETDMATNTGTVQGGNGGTVSLSASTGTVVDNGDGTWSWSFLTSDGPTDSQTVTITGDDGHGGTDSTSFDLVVDNVAPTITSVSNNGPIFAGGTATITVAATDPAGANDPLSYSFDCDNNGPFEVGPQAGNSTVCGFATAGSHTVNVRVTDGDGGVATGSTVVTVLPLPPDCSHATASPNLLWPPNHKFVPIQILGVTNGPAMITVTSIFQDEPVQSPGSGNTSPDATGVGTANPSVRAERGGGGDGRVYHITFTATGAGGSCTGMVTVGVPKSQSRNGSPVDQGGLYNSTLP